MLRGSGRAGKAEVTQHGTGDVDPRKGKSLHYQCRGLRRG